MITTTKLKLALLALVLIVIAVGVTWLICRHWAHTGAVNQPKLEALDNTLKNGLLTQEEL